MEKSIIIDQLKEFYRESTRLLKKGDTKKLRALYLQTSKKFTQLIPVTYFGLQHITALKEIYPNIIVASNHITTPSFFAIDEEEFIHELGLTKETLAWRQIQPLILRHYPLIQLLKMYRYEPAVVSSEDPSLLGALNRGWGNIIIPKTPGSRLHALRESIKYYPAERRAIIIFPEGQDSPEYLPEQYYRLEDFKSGFAVIAHDFAFPVIPTSMTFDMTKMEYTVRVVGVFLPPHNDIEYLRSATQESVMEGILSNAVVN